MTLFQVVDPHSERHGAGRAGWLRAAVLGANDGLVSTASLMVGVAASGAAGGVIVTAGLAGVAAGAMAMAAGEYVSVSSQVDVERADRALEARELAENPEAELAELAGIYRSRGVEPGLAGVLGAKAAGAGILRPALRVLIGGGLAMAITAAVGQLAHLSGI